MWYWVAFYFYTHTHTHTQSCTHKHTHAHTHIWSSMHEWRPTSHKALIQCTNTSSWMHEWQTTMAQARNLWHNVPILHPGHITDELQATADKALIQCTATNTSPLKHEWWNTSHKKLWHSILTLHPGCMNDEPHLKSWQTTFWYFNLAAWMMNHKPEHSRTAAMKYEIHQSTGPVTIIPKLWKLYFTGPQDQWKSCSSCEVCDSPIPSTSENHAGALKFVIHRSPGPVKIMWQLWSLWFTSPLD